MNSGNLTSTGENGGEETGNAPADRAVSKRTISQIAKAELAGRTDRVPGQFARYVASGATAASVDIVTFYLLYELAGLHHFIAKPISFFLANLTNYLICCLWVFSARSLKNRVAEYGMFLLIGLGGLCIAAAVLYAGVDVLGFYAPYANVCTIFFTVGWNFTMRKLVLFRNKR